MFGFIKRLFGKEGSSPGEENMSENSELLKAMEMRVQTEEATTLKAFYDALHGSTLLVALPEGRLDLVNTLVHRLRKGGQVAIDGISDEADGPAWSVFTHEAALRRWKPSHDLYTPVPAADVLWTADKNGLTIRINPADHRRVHLSRDEIAVLSAGRYPPAAESDALLAGTQLQVLPFEEMPSEALRDSIPRVLCVEPVISSAYLFRVRLGFRVQPLMLGLAFDNDVDQPAKNDICARVPKNARLPSDEAGQLAIIALWDSIMDTVAHHGVKVYDRERAAPHGFATVPAGCKVVVAQPLPRSGIWHMASGVWLIDFGPDTIDDPHFFQSVCTFLGKEPLAPVLWAVQGSAASRFPMKPEPLQRWLREIYELRRARAKLGGRTNDTFVVKAESTAQRTLAYLLLALGAPVHQAGPNGELFVEVHKEDGITVGMPGAAGRPLTPDECFVRSANERKDRLLPSEIETLAGIEREEREAIGRILSATPNLHWDSSAQDAVRA